MFYFLRTPLACNYNLFPCNGTSLFFFFIVHRIIFFSETENHIASWSPLCALESDSKIKNRQVQKANNGMKEGSPRQSWHIINQFPVTFQRKTSRALLSTIFGATVLALNCSLLKALAQKRAEPATPICSHLFLLKILLCQCFPDKRKKE